GSERRRVSRAGRAGDEHESARLVADFFDDDGKSELFEAEDLVGDLAIDGGGGTALIEDVRAEARQSFDAEGEVELERLFEAMLLRVGEDRVGELLRLRRRHRRNVERHELAVDTDLRRGVGGDVKVGATALDHGLEK